MRTSRRCLREPPLKDIACQGGEPLPRLQRVIAESPALAQPAGAGERPRPEKPLLRIRPSRGWQWLDLRTLWTFRELLLNFAWRDVKVRYKQTVLGLTWVVIQPLTQMVIFSIVFGRIAGLPSFGVPYALFAFSGLVPWTYFASTTSKMGSSLDGNMHLISKVYFPRILLPISVMLGTLVDFTVALPILVVMAIVLGVGLPATWLLLPLLVVVMMGVTFAFGVWLAALNARFRDVSIALPFVLQVGFYLTPVVFASSVVASIVPEWAYLLLAFLNPMLGVVEAFRWATLGVGEFPVAPLALSCVTSILLAVTGTAYFRATERTMVDRI